MKTPIGLRGHSSYLVGVDTVPSYKRSLRLLAGATRKLHLPTPTTLAGL
jgi:hypothetical protein